MTSSISSWLKIIGLDKYTDVFDQNEVDLDTLPYLTDEALKEMNVALGARLKILAAIAGQTKETLAQQSEFGPSTKAISSQRSVERRQLTVMFCDLVGSTALSGRLDPEEMRSVILSYQNAVAGEVSRFEGHVAKFMGDGVLVYFGWPKAHEDDAERAVRAAQAILSALANVLLSAVATIEARIGIATGLVVVGDLIGEGASQEEAVVGETPNLAARLQGMAEPGEVVISQSTRALLGELFELNNLGKQNLKGISTPTSAYAVLGERAITSRFDARTSQTLSPTVGRGQELALLKERWRQAKAGEGQMVLLSGEAGIGKSRIVRVIIDAIKKEPHVQINYQCSPYHGDTALYPVIQQLTRAANITPEEDSSLKLSKLRDLFQHHVDDYEKIEPLLAQLISIDPEDNPRKINLTPQQQRVRTLDALTEILLGFASQRPVLFIVEDAHWIDPTTLELIELCLERITSAPVFVLITTRPKQDPGFNNQSKVTQLALQRLSRDQILSVINQVCAGKPLAKDLIEEIVTKTDGVPLYVEELTKAVLDSGFTGIPSSLHDSLMARLDRIPEVKEIAQVAAALGRSFDYPLLAAITHKTQLELKECLDKLIQSELIFCRGKPPESSYTFKHALVRDAAHESLLKTRRQELHGEIAKTLTSKFPEISNSQPELLAYHYSEAREWFSAGECWLKAGDRSARAAANREAIAQLKHGLEVLVNLDANPDRWRLELELLMTLGGCLRTSKGWSNLETVDTVFRARQLCNQLGDSAYDGAIGLGEYTIHLLRGELDKALNSGQELLRLSAIKKNEVEAHIGHRSIGATLFHLGRFKESFTHLKTGLSIYDAQSEEQFVHKIGYFSGATFYNYLAHTLWHLGYPDQSLAYQNRGTTFVEELQHTPSLAFSLFQTSFHFGPSMRNEPRQQYATNQQFLSLSKEGGFDTWSILISSQQAFLDLEQDPEKNLNTIQSNLNWWQSQSGVLLIPLLYYILARFQHNLGNLKAANLSINTAIDWSERFNERWIMAELLRFKAKLLKPEGRKELQTRLDLLKKAMFIAHKQKSKAYELRSANCLAALYIEAGEQNKAHDLLAPLFDWYSEGFDTLDLKNAKTLLDESQ